MWITMWNTY